MHQLAPTGIMIFAAALAPTVPASPPDDQPSRTVPAPMPEIAPPEIFLDDIRDHESPDPANDPRYGVLTPLPATGFPPVIELRDGPADGELAFRAKVREYEKQINRIRHEHFGAIRVETIRQQGIAELREFTDPAAFRPMLTALARERDDVRLAVLDHLHNQKTLGQAALAWCAVYDDDAAIRHEAARRLSTPASPAVVHVLDTALRSEDDVVANNAGAIVGALDVVPLIPVMVAAQAAPREVQGQGDLAWIAIGRQEVFITGLTPVVGDNSGAFQPTLGTVQTGVVMRIMDAVVIVYRSYIHDALVAMTTRHTGQSTADLGYDAEAWRTWYNSVYIPMMQERAKLAELSEDPGAD